MTDLQTALRAGRASMPAAPTRPAVLVVGGGGALGSAVLETLLAGGGFSKVQLLVTKGFHAAMRGLELHVVALDQLKEPPAAPLSTTTAVVVFDRARRSNGREDAFMQPQPDALPLLARWLLAGGVRELVVVLPHDMTSLPPALQVGLANLDEQAVAALGFEHLVFVRPAQRPGQAHAAPWLQRVADGVMAQLRFMVPQAEQPVRVQKVAAFVRELVESLPASPPGTRVAAPELLWHAAQTRDLHALVHAWLHGQPLPPVKAHRLRM